jgi:hypothetical protein
MFDQPTQLLFHLQASSANGLCINLNPASSLKWQSTSLTPLLA